MKKILISIILLTFFTSSVFAHGGKLDANGCHMDKKAGKKHCHDQSKKKSKKSSKKKSKKSSKKKSKKSSKKKSKKSSKKKSKRSSKKK